MAPEAICKACGTGFAPGPQNKTRCPSCVNANRQARKNTCRSCRRQWIPSGFHDKTPICRRCAAEGITLEAVLLEQERERRDALGANGEDLDDFLKEEAAYRRERAKAQFRKRRAEEEAELHERFLRKTKNFIRMSKAQMNKPSAINIFWLRLCAFDGAAGLLLETEATALDQKTKVTLHLAFARMRMRGFDAETLRHLDAHQFLKIGADLNLLPEVTAAPDEDHNPIHFTHTQQAAATILGAD